MSEVFALDYDSEKVMTGIDTADVDHIRVLILSGDEILTITTKSGKTVEVDASNCREINYYDGQYDVNPAELGEWMKRTSSYDQWR